ncbi:nitrate- and nitrite sensing domain-containing protein [Streptomyces sp. NPDC090445]|uniref:sensor histidine kinase n=1 Tax=Streptomyces sp. NPDC090445 TaxID=3365963 RepID=UPI00380F5A27
MRTPRRQPEPAAQQLPALPARGRRAHAGPPADEPEPEPGRGPAPADPAGAGAGVSAGSGSGSGSGAAAGAARPYPGRRPRLRPATVRAKIVSLLMVPVVSLLALWGFATVGTAQDIARIGRSQRIDDRIRTPVAAAVTELQAERRAAVRFLADPVPDRAAELDKQQRRTDDAVRRLRLGDRHTVAESGDHRTELVVRLGAFVAAAEGLGPARKDINDRRATPDAAYETYTRVVDSAFAVTGNLSGGEQSELGPEARVLLEFARAGELLAREDALISLPGQRSTESLRRLTGAVETRRALTVSSADDLPAAQRDAWQAVAKSSAYADLTGAEDRVLTAGTAKDPRAAAAGWDAAYASISTSMREIETAAHAAADRGDPLTEGLGGPAGAAVLLGLAAIAASLVISVRIGRGLVVELVTLRDTALDIAHRKLPHAMHRLRAGEAIDVEAEAPPGPAAEDEITQVGEALATVHRAALGAAAERAELAGGISGVFVNLARRSQVLVHRQLSLLDSMERRADDPGELGDLFRLDHLTTRMRRHAESLIILSGAAPGRAWRTPVLLTNVVRAAVSEIEDYPRVEMGRVAEAAVIGAAVADLTHLLAELIENATQFSPPHTKVRVTGEPVGAGYVLEVEDRGLGMGSDSLAEANRRIRESEALDLFDSDRLGLFVVSRLSARHRVKVHLRPSPYGGTTAVVLLPKLLLQGAIEQDSAPAADPSQEPRTEPPGAPTREPDREPPAVAAVREDARGVPAADRGPVRKEPQPAPVSPLRPRGGAGARTQAPVPAAAAEEPAPRTPPPSTPEPEPDPQPVPKPVPKPVPEPEPVPAPVPAAAGPRSAPVPVPAPLPVPESPGAGAGAGTGTGDAAEAELPRRVRQASLVPQLRKAPDPKTPASGAGAQPPAEEPVRSPEQARDRMAAYRAGWARGARENSAHPGSEGEA